MSATAFATSVRRRSSTVSMVSPFIVISLALSLASVSRVLGELECRRHPMPSDFSHFLMTTSADEARNTAVCHAICLDYIFNGTAMTNFIYTAPGNSSNVEVEVCAIRECQCHHYLYVVMALALALCVLGNCTFD